MNFILWLKTIRVQTLVASIIPIALTHILIIHGYDIVVLVCSILSALSIQIATNLFNDLHDFESGVDTGVKKERALQLGLIGKNKFTDITICFFIVAALFGIPLVIKGGFLILFIGLASLICAHGYTGGILRLSQRGIAESFVMLFFGIIPVFVMCRLSMVQFNKEALALGVLCGAFSCILLVVNNLRDVTTDERAKKKTLVVRCGVNFGRLELLFLSAVVFLISFIFFPVYVVFLLPSLIILTISSVYGVCFAATKKMNVSLKLTAIAYLAWCFGIFVGHTV